MASGGGYVGSGGGRGQKELGGLKESKRENVGGSSKESFCNLSLDFEMDYARPYTRLAKLPHHSLDK